MQQNLGFLFAAFALTWAAFFVYLFFIQRLLADTGRRIKALERQPSTGRSETPLADRSGG